LFIIIFRKIVDWAAITIPQATDQEKKICPVQSLEKKNHDETGRGDITTNPRNCSAYPIAAMLVAYHQNRFLRSFHLNGNR
jgi:hypothetical protein